MSHQSRFDARYWMLGAGALGRPRGMVWGERREEGSGWGKKENKTKKRSEKKKKSNLSKKVGSERSSLFSCAPSCIFAFYVFYIIRILYT